MAVPEIQRVNKHCRYPVEPRCYPRAWQLATEAVDAEQSIHGGTIVYDRSIRVRCVTDYQKFGAPTIYLREKNNEDSTDASDLVNGGGFIHRGGGLTRWRCPGGGSL